MNANEAYDIATYDDLVATRDEFCEGCKGDPIFFDSCHLHCEDFLNQLAKDMTACEDDAND